MYEKEDTIFSNLLSSSWKSIFYLLKLFSLIMKIQAPRSLVLAGILGVGVGRKHCRSHSLSEDSKS